MANNEIFGTCTYHIVKPSLPAYAKNECRQRRMPKLRPLAKLSTCLFLFENNFTTHMRYVQESLYAATICSPD